MDLFTAKHDAALALTVKLMDYPDAVIPKDAKGNPEVIAKSVAALYNMILESLKV